MPYEPVVPEGQHLGTSHEVDGAVTGHLFDDDTNELKGHAAWQLVDEPDDPDDSSYDYNRDNDSQHTLTPEQQELADAIAAAIVVLVVIGVAKATPHVVRFFKEKFAPGVKSAWERARSFRYSKVKTAEPKSTARDAMNEAEPTHKLIIVDAEPSSEVAVIDPDLTMSSGEWAQRYNAMLAAEAFSEEQRRILSQAKIVDPVAEVEAAASSAEVLARVKLMIEQNPALLNEEFSAELLKLIRTQADRGDEPDASPALA